MAAAGSALSFRRVAPADAAETTSTVAVIDVLSEALASEGLALYFTRRNREAAQRLWGELLRLTLAAAGPASTAPQLYFLSDLTTAAVLQRYPEDRVGFHPYGALLRLCKLCPVGKWRALREALLALEKQKAAFAAAEGPFLYLAAAATAEEFRGAGLGSMLLDRCCREADAQRRCLYVDVSSDQARAFFRRLGFAELMRHVVRPHAPPICVMVRRPRPATADPPEPAATTSRPSAGGWVEGQRASSSGGGTGAAGAAAAGSTPPKLRPSGSVRTR